MTTRGKAETSLSWDKVYMQTAKARPAAPKRKRGTLTRPMIMDVSAAMFQEKGYDRTSLDDIAKALSITKPSLYYHFTSKENILLECISSGYQHFQDELLRRDDLKLPGRDRVKIFLETYLDVINNNLGLSMIVADDRVMMAETKKTYDSYRRALNNELEIRMKQGVEDGSLNATETRITAYAIFGMLNWVGHWHLRKNTTPRDVVQYLVFALIFDGIGAKKPIQDI